MMVVLLLRMHCLRSSVCAYREQTAIAITRLRDSYVAPSFAWHTPRQGLSNQPHLEISLVRIPQIAKACQACGVVGLGPALGHRDRGLREISVARFARVLIGPSVGRTSVPSCFSSSRRKRCSDMCSHYLFDPDFCNVASGWEKGVVEKNVQDSRRRIWIEAATRCFGSFIELNAG